MNIETYHPSGQLSPYIKNYLVIESEDERVNRIFPGTSLVMAFRYKGQIRHFTNSFYEGLPPFVLSGMRKSGRLINYSKGAGNILVLFKEAGARAFIKEPLHEVFEESVSLDNFAGYRELSSLEEQLATATSNEMRVRQVEMFLLSRLQQDDKPDLLISPALERIRLANGVIRIKELADSLCMSLDPFEKRFRRVVGATPKQFSYLIRMQSIVKTGLQKQALVETAFNAGYFDQAHFNKDFKLFTGQTPTEFLKSPRYW